MVKFFKVPFAEQGDKDPIPTGAQPDGSVSYTTGYTPDYEKDLEGPDPTAKPVERTSFNALFNSITEALGFAQGHGASDWSADGKPYALNALVRFDDKNWISLIPVNNVQPIEGTAWTEFSAEVLKKKLDRMDVVQTTGTQVGKVMSQKAATDLLELKIDKTAVKQSSGNSSSDIMSQRAVGESINAAIAPKSDSVTVNQQLALKIDKTAVKQSSGNSSSDIMSQRAVTDALNTKVDLSGNQTIAGVKTFSSFPVTPSAAPTDNYQAANKKYVDDSAIGVGQTWQDVKSQRQPNVTYTNTTGRPIVCFIDADSTSGKISINGQDFQSNNPQYGASYILPAGNTIRVSFAGFSWWELR